MALEPITREEQIIAGKDLKPITRMEMFLKQYGGGSGGGASGQGFKVTFAMDKSGAVVADKTYYEIYNAYMAGKNICGVMVNGTNDFNVLNLDGVNGDEVTFHAMQVIPNDGSGFIIYLHYPRTGSIRAFMFQMTFTET